MRAVVTSDFVTSPGAPKEELLSPPSTCINDSGSAIPLVGTLAKAPPSDMASANDAGVKLSTGRTNPPSSSEFSENLDINLASMLW